MKELSGACSDDLIKFYHEKWVRQKARTQERRRTGDVRRSQLPFKMTEDEMVSAILLTLAGTRWLICEGCIWTDSCDRLRRSPKAMDNFRGSSERSNKD